MKITINTLKDLCEALANVQMPIGMAPGEGDLQEVRFANGDALVLVVEQYKFGDVVSFEIASPADRVS